MKKIIILSLSTDETEIISSKLKEEALVSTNLWDDLINRPIDLDQIADDLFSIISNKGSLIVFPYGPLLTIPLTATMEPGE